MLPWTTSIWQRDSQPNAPGKSGAVQMAKLVEHDHVERGELSCQGPDLADPDLFLEPVHSVDPFNLFLSL